jgi:hypothetical protein
MERSSAIEIPKNETVYYIKTHPSPRPHEKKSSIKQAQRNRKLLTEKLKEKPDCFWMWTAEESAFHSLYEAENKNDIILITNYCNPSLRMEKYSILSSIMLAPNIIFQEKKEIITQLLSQNYIPTRADKEINSIETQERCQKKGIKKPISQPIFNAESLL